jgi:hypothetical protein
MSLISWRMNLPTSANKRRWSVSVDAGDAQVSWAGHPTEDLRAILRVTSHDVEIFIRGKPLSYGCRLPLANAGNAIAGNHNLHPDR